MQGLILENIIAKLLVTSRFDQNLECVGYFSQYYVFSISLDTVLGIFSRVFHKWMLLYPTAIRRDSIYFVRQKYYTCRPSSNNTGFIYFTTILFWFLK